MKKILSLMAFAAMAVSAQEQAASPYGMFTVDAQVRTRGEFRTGWGTSDDGSENSNLFAGDRVRLSFGWERKNLSMRIAAQHTGLWQDGGQKSTSGNIALHEAWARMAFGKGFFAQTGRQELRYDDERLLGSHDWASTGRTHDALRIGWEGTRHRLHAAVAFKETADVPDGAKPYKNMQMLWYHFGEDKQPFQISAVFINHGVGDDSGSGVDYMQTFGTYASFEKHRFFSNASFYYQVGSDRTGTDVSAFMMNANLGLRFSRRWEVSIGDDYLSGGDGMPGTNRTFNLLWGSYHDFFGKMDCFGYGTIPSYGLNDLNATAQLKACRKLDMSLSCHWLMTGRPINDYLKDPIEQLTDPEKILIMRRYNGKYRFSRNLGTEVDIEACYRPWKDVAIEAGLSLLFSTETITLLETPDANTFQSKGWLTLNINPTVFSTKHRRP